MFTELMLHKNPALIVAFTGIPAEEFWVMLEQMETKFLEYEVERHCRDDRQRALGAGRKFNQSLSKRAMGSVGIFTSTCASSGHCAHVWVNAM